MRSLVSILCNLQVIWFKCSISFMSCFVCMDLNKQCLKVSNLFLLICLLTSSLFCLLCVSSPSSSSVWMLKYVVGFCVGGCGSPGGVGGVEAEGDSFYISYKL